MQINSSLIFKIADQETEFEKLLNLSYRTFVEEIPQHDWNSDKKLADRFHKENTYIICLKGDELVGMVAVRDKRPFSLDQKLENLDSYLPQGCSICEIRLLSVERNHRSGVIFQGLMTLLYEFCRNQSYNLAVISGTVRQQKLYEHLGFVPFGPLVGTEKARFQPMYLTLEAFEARFKDLFQKPRKPFIRKTYVNLLPGPASINRYVKQVFGELPVSHRSDSFVVDFHETQQLLCDLVCSQRVEILLGSGTLANDAIAGQLSLTSKPGLVLSNGEFGDRLIDHATRFGLRFDALRINWGDVFNPSDIRHRIYQSPRIQWVWAVHCETSTGVLNDMGVLKRLCADTGIRLCVDCISSIGTVPVNLSDVFLASGVSGKGLGAFSGLAMVFYNHKIPPAPEMLPRYLDLGYYATTSGIPFTLSSNLLYALRAALKYRQFETVFKRTLHVSLWLKSRLRELGLSIIAPDSSASPAVITVALPKTISSKEIGYHLEKAGYLLSYNSVYLHRRNWVQICLMGEYTESRLVSLLDAMQEFLHPVTRASKLTDSIASPLLL